MEVNFGSRQQGRLGGFKAKVKGQTNLSPTCILLTSCGTWGKIPSPPGSSGALTYKMRMTVLTTQGRRIRRVGHRRCL